MMRRLGLLTALFILVLDQVSKHWILALLLGQEPPVRLTAFANLVVVWNRGISFGILSHHPENLTIVWIVLALGISVLLLRWLWKAHTQQVALALGLILGGAIGNVVDRLRFNAVFDFLDLHAGDLHWPAFNVADSAIVVGVLLLMLDSLCNKSKPS